MLCVCLLSYYQVGVWKGEIHYGGQKRLYKTTYFLPEKQSYGDFYYIANFPVGNSAMKNMANFPGGGGRGTTRGRGWSGEATL